MRLSILLVTLVLVIGSCQVNEKPDKTVKIEFDMKYQEGPNWQLLQINNKDVTSPHTVELKSGETVNWRVECYLKSWDPWTHYEYKRPEYYELFIRKDGDLYDIKEGSGEGSGSVKN